MDLNFEVLTARSIPYAWRPIVCRMLAGIRSELAPHQLKVFELIDVKEENGDLHVVWSYPGDDLTDTASVAIGSHIMDAEEKVEDLEFGPIYAAEQALIRCYPASWTPAIEQLMDEIAGVLMPAQRAAFRLTDVKELRGALRVCWQVDAELDAVTAATIERLIEQAKSAIAGLPV